MVALVDIDTSSIEALIGGENELKERFESTLAAFTKAMGELKTQYDSLFG